MTSDTAVSLYHTSELCPAVAPPMPQAINIRESSDGRICVTGAREVEAGSLEELLAVLEQGVRVRCAAWPIAPRGSTIPPEVLQGVRTCCGECCIARNHQPICQYTERTMRCVEQRGSRCCQVNTFVLTAATQKLSHCVRAGTQSSVRMMGLPKLDVALY